MICCETIKYKILEVTLNMIYKLQYHYQYEKITYIVAFIDLVTKASHSAYNV